jgi:hypothetical protein
LPEILNMKTQYFSLGNVEKNRLVNVIRILFGAVCFAVAAFWLIFNIQSIENFGTTWITIIFLTGFGFYLVWAGIGKAERYIEIGKDNILVKKYIFLKPLKMAATETEKICFFPLKVIFLLKSGKKILLRFGTLYYESNEKIIDEISKYAEGNKIPTEVIQEEI